MDWTDNYNTIMNAEGFGMSKKQSMAIDFSGQPAPVPWLWQWRVHGSGKEPYRVSVRKFNMADAVEWGCACPAISVRHSQGTSAGSKSVKENHVNTSTAEVNTR